MSVVKAKEIESFTPAFLSAVIEAKRYNKTTFYWDWINIPTRKGVDVRLKGTSTVRYHFSNKLLSTSKYDSRVGRWYVPSRIKMGGQTSKVLLQLEGGPKHYQELLNRSGLSDKEFQVAMQRLRDRRLVERVSRGIYEKTPKAVRYV